MVGSQDKVVGLASEPCCMCMSQDLSPQTSTSADPSAISSDRRNALAR